MGTVPCGHNCGWAQYRVVTVAVGHNTVWAQSSGHNSVGTITHGHSPASSVENIGLCFIFGFINFIYNESYCNQYVSLNSCFEHCHSNMNENSLIKSRDCHDSYKYRLQSPSSSFAKIFNCYDHFTFLCLETVGTCTKYSLRHIKVFLPHLSELNL